MLLRAFCFAAFLFSALLVVVVLSDFKSAIKTILPPSTIVAVVTFSAWYLLKGVNQEDHSRKPSTYPAEGRSANSATLQHEVRRIRSELLRKNSILSAIASSLIGWEKAEGRISAEQTLHDLADALRKLADGFADSERSRP